jgi:hypothetical protein
MVIGLYCTLKPVVCNRDRGVLFRKTEPSLNRENAEMKAREMLFGLPHLPQNNIWMYLLIYHVKPHKMFG